MLPNAAGMTQAAPSPYKLGRGCRFSWWAAVCASDSPSPHKLARCSGWARRRSSNGPSSADTNATLAAATASMTKVIVRERLHLISIAGGRRGRVVSLSSPLDKTC